MRARWPAFIVLIVAGLAAIALLAWLGSHDAAGAASQPVAHAEPGPGSDTALSAPAAAGDAVALPLTAGPRPAVALTGGEDVAAAAAPASPANVARVSCRLLMPDGTPAGGIPWSLEGWLHPQRSAALTSAVEFTQLKGWSDASGIIDFTFEPPVPFGFGLGIEAPESVPLAWVWQRVRPGQRLELGDITLVRGGTVRGRVVDRQGQPVILGSQWEVYVEATSPTDTTWTGNESDTADLRVHPRPTETVCRPDGSFLITGVMPGLTALHVHMESQGNISAKPFEVTAGSESWVEVLYAASPPERCVFVRARGFTDRPHQWLLPTMATLSGPAIGTRPAKDGGIGAIFEDVPPGRYSLSIDNPAYDHWQRDDVEPGPDPVMAFLVGAASIDLTVAEAGSGHAIESFGAEFDAAFVPIVTPTRTFAGGHVLLAQLPAEDVRLTVWAPGHASQLVRATLKPHEVLALRVELQPAAAIAGVVVAPDGSPLPDVVVGLYAPAKGDDGPATPLFRDWDLYGDYEGYHTRIEQFAETTDPEGRFSFPDAPPGTWIVRAYRSSALHVATEPLAMGTGADTTDLRLVLEAGHAVMGRLLGPPGARYDGIRLRALAAGAGANKDVPLTTVVEADGTFRFDALPAGDVRIYCPVEPEWTQQVEGQGPYGPLGRLLGNVMLTADADATVAFDLGEGVPGRARLRVRVDGEFVVDHVYPSLVTDDETRRVIAYGQSSDGESFEVGPLLPTTAAILVQGDPGHWSFEAPDRITIEPGATTERTIDVQLVESFVTCLDELSGEPLADKGIVVLESGVLPTDSQGRLTIRLPVGCVLEIGPALELFGEEASDFLVAASARGILPKATQRVTWTTHGPEPASIRLAVESVRPH